jgi:uncharacterized protein (TIGR03067 family)
VGVGVRVRLRGLSRPEGFYLIMGQLAHNRRPRDDDEDDRNRLVLQGIRVIARDDIVITGDDGAGGVAVGASRPPTRSGSGCWRRRRALVDSRVESHNPGRHTMTKVAVGIVIAFVAVGLTVGADDTKDEAVKKELKKFEGTWVAVSLSVNDQESTKESLEDVKVEFKGDKWTAFKKGSENSRGSIKVDPSKKPPEIVNTWEDPYWNATITLKGIYKFDGDTLTTCWDLSGKRRPIEFKGLLFVLKKQKP